MRASPQHCEPRVGPQHDTRLSLGGLNERLAITLEIIAGVIAKKIVEHASRCYVRTTTVSQRRSRPAPSLFFYRQHDGQKAILMKP